MKTLIGILITAFSCTHPAQAQLPAPGSYITNNTMTAFHGNWRWVSGTDTVLVYLTTKKVRLDGNNYDEDLLVGWHLYKKGNVVVESSYTDINNVNASTIALWNENVPNDPKIEGVIKDISKANKSNFLYLTLNASLNQLTWRCTETGGRVYSGSQVLPPLGVTLPRNIVLTKL